MKAFFFHTSTTDLVRTTAEPLINHTDKGLYTDYKDFVLECVIRFMGIKRNYPTAEFVDTGNGVCVFVDGVMVYESHILYVEPNAVEVPDEDEV